MKKKFVNFAIIFVVIVVAAGAFFTFREHKLIGQKNITEQKYTNSIGMEFSLLSRGSFSMGSEIGFANEKPQHIVRISKDFYIGKYEVTQKQWEQLMGFNPSKFKNEFAPVESVSWYEAKRFIAKLNETEKTLRYRLPTEAEWEYAARAATMSKYSFGDDESVIGKYAWYYDNWDNKIKNRTFSTHAVGQKEPNKWGLYDMHGNVWEWVEDGYESNFYANSASKDPKNLVENGAKVIRGGSWINSPEYLRSATRHNKPYLYAGDDVGFRVVMEIAEPK